MPRSRDGLRRFVFGGICTDAVFPTRSVPLIGFLGFFLVWPSGALFSSPDCGGHGAAGVGKSSLISDLIHEGFQPTVQAVLPIVVLPPEGTFGCVRPRVRRRGLAPALAGIMPLAIPRVPVLAAGASATQGGDANVRRAAALVRSSSRCSPARSCRLCWLAFVPPLCAVIPRVR